jgi:hypothetical protein
MRSPKDGRPHAGWSIRGILTALLFCAGIAGGWTEAWAELSFTVLNPDRTAVAGGSETFLGTITNNTGATLSTQDIFVDASGFDTTHLSITELLGNVPFTINQGTTSPPLDLFRVNLAAGTPPGLYPIDVMLQTDGTFTSAETVSLRVVPEPSAYALMMIGLLLAAWKSVMRTAPSLRRRLIGARPAQRGAVATP